ncbi:MAG: trypsin-like serine protease [Hyphomicrobiaceae bacterium]
MSVALPAGGASAQKNRTHARLTQPQSKAALAAQQRFVSALEGYAARHAAAGSARYWAILRFNLARVKPDTETTPRFFSETVQAAAQDRNGTTERIVRRILSEARNSVRIMGGRPVKANEFRNVVALVRGETALCVGTLIGKRAVLTAGRCVCSLRTTLEAPHAPDEIVFGTKVPAAAAVRFSIIGYSSFAPDLCRARAAPIAGKDLAIVHFKDNSKGDARLLILAPLEAVVHDRATRPFTGIVAAPLAGPSLLFAPTVTDMQLIGFGLTEKGETGPKMHTEMAVQNLICVSQVRNAATCKPGREMVLADQAGLGDRCRGDRGGPAFIFYNDRYYLAAVTSRPVDAEGHCGAGGIYSLLTPSVVRWLAGELSIDVAVCEASGDCFLRQTGD